VLTIITHYYGAGDGKGDDEASVKEKKEKALAEHLAAHPEDAGRMVEDFDWSTWEIVHSLSPAEKAEISAAARNEDEIEDEIEDEFKSIPLNGQKGTDGPSEMSEPIDLPPLAPPIVRSKPWRPMHQRPARDMRRPTWKEWGRHCQAAQRQRAHY
jgi:hypothetical protein